MSGAVLIQSKVMASRSEQARYGGPGGRALASLVHGSGVRAGGRGAASPAFAPPGAIRARWAPLPAYARLLVTASIAWHPLRLVGIVVSDKTGFLRFYHNLDNI